MTSLVIELRLDVPFGIFKELVNVFSKHLFEILIFQAFLAALFPFVTHFLDLRLAVRFMSSSFARSATFLRASVALRFKASVSHHGVVLCLWRFHSWSRLRLPCRRIEPRD